MKNTLFTLTAVVVVSFLLLACSKISTAPVDDTLQSVAQTDKSGIPYQTYGLIADGTTDNTAALQKLIDETAEIHLKAGTYIINQTLNLKAGIKIYGEAATIIKAGTQMSGTLLTNGRYLFGGTADNVLISQITFRQSDNAYQFSDWNNSAIYLLNSKNVTVQNSTFDFHLPYSTRGMEAVWVSGTGSANNVLKNNKIKTLGIKYAENGADGTLVEGNVLTNAYSNALTANGNHPSDMITGCKILSNTITNAGRMGIEDWGNADGSLIRGNKINGTGKDPKQAIDGIALSAVGTNVQVISNTITDCKLYAIEVRGNYGVTVTGNILSDNPAATGIILNYTFATPANVSASNVAGISGNRITNNEIGVHVFGDYTANALIQNNAFINIISKGISVESGAQLYKLDIAKNKFTYTVKTEKDRYGIFTYTRFDPGAASQIINLTADTSNYSSTAAGGAGMDMGYVIRTDKATISNIYFQGNNNKSASGVAITALTAFGGKPTGIKLINNMVLGAKTDLSGFISNTSSGNNF